MKAFLLAAGHGSRLRPITDTIAKCLVPICGKPLLQIWLELCQTHGVDEVLINLHAHASLVRDFLSRNEVGVHVTISEESDLLGSAGTLAHNRDWVASEREFWILYADVLTNADLTDMLRFHRERSPVVTLGVYEVSEPKRCGIVTPDENGIVQAFVEKPERPTSNLAFSGLLLATPALFDFIPDQVPVDIGFSVLPRLVGQMAAYRVKEFLVDIGTMPNYRKAQDDWPTVVARRAGVKSN
jgi:mannose-1-phosphate guanylyltransferase